MIAAEFVDNTWNCLDRMVFVTEAESRQNGRQERAATARLARSQRVIIREKRSPLPDDFWQEWFGVWR